MSSELWCQNCHQRVNQEKKKSQQGCIFGVALLLLVPVGGLLYAAEPALGVLIFVVLGLWFFVALVGELLHAASKGWCPICKGRNLIKG